MPPRSVKRGRGTRRHVAADKAMSTDYRWLFDSLAPLVADIPPVQDQAMLQLHALFGPMLMSALQLIDRREGEWRGSSVLSSTCFVFDGLIDVVVRVTLPSHRQVYQVRRGADRHANNPSRRHHGEACDQGAD